MKLSEQLFSLFVNREDVYSVQKLRRNKKEKYFLLVQEPITAELIERHLKNIKYIGVYQLDKKNQVKWICLDFDKDTEEDFNKALQLSLFLTKRGFHPLLEKSGGGEYKVHLWIFCEPVSAGNAMSWAEAICKEAGIYPHEIFPKQAKIDEEGYGNLVKLPLGINLTTGKNSEFCSDKTAEEVLKYHLENLDKIPEAQATLPKTEESSEEAEPKEEVKPIATEEITIKKHQYDSFFEYVLNTELPAGKTAEEKTNPKIVGINNNLLKNEAVWLYEKGYSLEKLEKDIKPIYEAKGWAFGDLKGWFKKVQKGDIKEIARGELVEWCKTYYPDLLRLIPFEAFYVQSKDIKPYTAHLPYFEELRKVLKLEGNLYYEISKEVYRSLVSLAVPEPLLIAKINNLETDLRNHSLFLIPSGKGKLNIKESLKEIFLRFNNQGVVKEPRTIFHEQLIGKILTRWEEVPVLDVEGNKVFDRNQVLRTKKVEKKYKKLGYLFSSDLLFLEEAYEILTGTDKNEIAIRDSLCVALDTYLKNIVLKENIDDLDIPEENLSGYPKLNCVAFCQPLSFIEKFFTKGLARRFSLIYKKFPLRSDVESFKNRRTAENNSVEAVMKLAEFLRKIHSVRGSFSFESLEAENRFDELHLALLNQGFFQKGKKANYTSILEYPLQNQLLKFCCFNALAELKTTISLKNVETAFLDLLERFILELNFVEEKVLGNLDYEASYKNVDKKQAECLDYLYNEGALSEESSNISIELFKAKISAILNRSKRTAQTFYLQLEEEGLISTSKPSPQNRLSKVWLNIQSQVQEKQQKQEGIPPLNLICPITIYNNLLSKFKVGVQQKQQKQKAYTPI